MPTPSLVRLGGYITKIPTHSIDLPAEAARPRFHYERSAADSVATIDYFSRNLARVQVDTAAAERHLRRLYGMVVLTLIETFERFLKELAAVCIDQIGEYVIDDRLNVFTIRGNVLAAHFAEKSIGKALCESSTWLDCDEITRRFRKILADPFEDGNFHLFRPRTDRYRVVEALWQIRHSIVHNAGVVTRSDALKLRLLTREPVESPRLLWPTRGDVWYVKLYLDRIVEEVNREVGERLGVLLTTVWGDDPALFDPSAKAQELANLFGVPATVGGMTSSPP